MGTNTGKNHRKGSIKNRSQCLNTKTGNYIKRGADGKFLKVKKDKTPFKGVKKEKSNKSKKKLKK